MIGLPFNDLACLEAISQLIADRAANRDPVFAELADRYPTTRSLIEYIRSLPQRDDLGDPADGPRVQACSPPQRVRFGVRDPNCVERAALFLGVEELRDPDPTRQLATVNTPVGLHTFPLVNGRPIVLDPRVTQDCLDCGVALATPGAMALEPRKALAWTADMAAAGAGRVRNGNGPSAIYVARNAIRRLIDRSTLPAESEIRAMAVMFALAEQIANHYGTRALAIVRTAARAVSEVIDAVLATRRNVSVRIGDLAFSTPKWLDDTAVAVGKTGLDLGSVALRSELGSLGVGADVLGLLESQLNAQGRTLGALAHPPQLATFAKFAAPRTA